MYELSPGVKICHDNTDQGVRKVGTCALVATQCKATA